MAKNALVICGAFCSGLAVMAGGSLLFWRWWKGSKCCNDDEDTEWTEEMVDTWVGYHYAAPRTYVPFTCVSEDALDFPVKCAQLCKRFKSVSYISSETATDHDQ